MQQDSPDSHLEGPVHIADKDTPKSRRTRKRILDATMQLLADAGFHGATNARIAEAAALTRGAMLYHFPTRESLLDAVVSHIQEQRMRLLQEAAKAQPVGADAAEHAIDAYWRLLHEVPYLAFAELENAARTDLEVRKRLEPAQRAFDRAYVGDEPLAMVHAGQGPRLQAGRDLARFLLEGLARGAMAHDADDRVERLLTVIKRATHMLNRKHAVPDLWPE